MAEEQLTPSWAPWLARIRRTEEGPPTGAGVVCTPDHVITCAHVLSDGQAPKSPPFVDLPFAAGQPTPAEVAVWRPGGEDVAVLQFGRPVPGQYVTPICGGEMVSGQPYAAYGFPAGHSIGKWTYGVITGPLADGKLQLDATGSSGFPIDHGFSGSPIWSVERRAVVGIVNAKTQTPNVRAGTGIPGHVLRRLWPALPMPRSTVFLRLRGPDGFTLEITLQGACERRTGVLLGRVEHANLAGPDGTVVERDPQTGDDRVLIPALRVGKRHCRVYLDGGRWWLANLHDNGVALQRAGRREVSRVTKPAVFLQPGDSFHLPAQQIGGEWYVQVEFCDPHHTTVHIHS